MGVGNERVTKFGVAFDGKPDIRSGGIPCGASMIDYERVMNWKLERNQNWIYEPLVVY